MCSSSGVAGGLSLCCFYSLDSARIRFANDLRSSKKGDDQRKYKSLFDVYRKTLATEGIAGLHRGFVISCVGVIIYRGCYFGFYDTLKPILLDPDASIALSFLLGYSVTVTANSMSHPVGMIRLRMMMRSRQAFKYNESLDCMFQIIRNEGVIALFKRVDAYSVRFIASAGVLVGFDKLV
jgi:solute carrier family 25 (adenine nucleotide translocator) protein 4/5/6/31